MDQEETSGGGGDKPTEGRDQGEKDDAGPPATAAAVAAAAEAQKQEEEKNSPGCAKDRLLSNGSGGGVAEDGGGRGTVGGTTVMNGNMNILVNATSVVSPQEGAGDGDVGGDISGGNGAMRPKLDVDGDASGSSAVSEKEDQTQDGSSRNEKAVVSSPNNGNPGDTCETPTRRNLGVKGVGPIGAEKLAVPDVDVAHSQSEEDGSMGSSSSAAAAAAAAVAATAAPPSGVSRDTSADAPSDGSDGLSPDELSCAGSVAAATVQEVKETLSPGSETPPLLLPLRRADTAPPELGLASADSPRAASFDGEGDGLPPRPPAALTGAGMNRMPPQMLADKERHIQQQRQQQQQQQQQYQQQGGEHSVSMGPSVPNHDHSYQQSLVPPFGAGAGTKPPSPPAPGAVVVEAEGTATMGRAQGANAGPGVMLQKPTEEEVSSSMEAIISSPPVQQSNENIVERSPGGRYLRFQEKLGSGAYKDVYRAYDTIEGIEVAWNVVNLAGVPKSERARIVHEVRLLERLHHKNIISFHGSWVNREKEQVIFVTEILSSGTLKSFINKVQVIRWKIAKRWAIQILKGLEYLHSQDPPIIHRDLKCDNIFINGTSGDLRIGDLGLSTVIDNKNKVLSVLGTPEFMAPELYDESYDEKVDIYAFGMCLLEIFTKEVPYRECANPAQIYKRVMNGIPPNSLSRVRNLEAKEFIMHCLGTGQGREPHSRPSASELLCHPFLANKKVDDNSEVEVDPGFDQLGTVQEANSLGEVSILTASTKGPSEVDHAGAAPSFNQMQPPPIHGVDSQEASLQAPQLPPQQPQQQQQQQQQLSSQSIIEPHTKAAAEPVRRSTRDITGHGAGDDDHFSGMPESETHMKKVKVLMGRGEEIEDDDDDDHNGPIQTPLPPTARKGSAEEASMKSSVDGEKNTAPSDSRYCAFAAVIEEEMLGANPYEDDVMKLVITLPVEGKSQNVQFDFHLVEDDPVQVAREMVSELQIPEDAVLEISETISGLARSARIKQGKRVGQQPSRAEQSVSSERQQQQQQRPQHVSTTPATVDGDEQGETDTEAALQKPQHDQASVRRVPVLPDIPAVVASLPVRPDRTIVAAEPSPSIQQSLDVFGHEQPPPQVDDADESDAESDDELRQLEETFQKNIHRAKKAFDTRMDNLQRSKVEKEAQHLKTLEKHEKEKAEFEKRVKLAEEEQNRRLELLEKELARKKEELVKARHHGKPGSDEEEDCDDAGNISSPDDPKALASRIRSQDNLSTTVPLGPSTSQDRSRSASNTSLSASEDSGGERA